MKSDDDEEYPDPYPLGDLLDSCREWPSIEVEMTEPTVVGHLLDHRGEPLITFYDRTVIPFGFQIP
jgi:hypothetical protein